jgi:hypothetical protein
MLSAGFCLVSAWGSGNKCHGFFMWMPVRGHSRHPGRTSFGIFYPRGRSGLGL